MAKAKGTPESAAWAALGASPRLVALKKKIEKAEADYERWYTRLKRAITKMEDARQLAKRTQKILDREAAEQPKEKT